MNLKPLPSDLCAHLTEISGNELKVWMYYYTLADQLTCGPSNLTILTKTGLSERTVKGCKRNLIRKGWLHYTGEYKRPRKGNGHHTRYGEFSVPVMELRLPWMPDWVTIVQNLQFTIGQNLPAGSCSGSGSDSRYGAVAALIVSKYGSVSQPSPPASLEERKTSNGQAKPKPEPTPTPKIRLAKDGTPWPPEFDSWKNAERLNWLMAHGYDCGLLTPSTDWEDARYQAVEDSMAASKLDEDMAALKLEEEIGRQQDWERETLWQETSAPVAAHGKTNPLLPPPGSPAPPVAVAPVHSSPMCEDFYDDDCPACEMEKRRPQVLSLHSDG